MANHSVIVVGLSGATNSGKTSLSKLLTRDLPQCHVISQDHYYYNLGHPSLQWVPEVKHHNWEDLSALDMKRLASDVEMYVKDNTAMSSEGKNPLRVLIVEGFRILAYKPLAKLLNMKYFLTITEEICKERRKGRRYYPPDVPGYFEGVVWPEYIKHLHELKQENDIEYLDSTGDQESIYHRVLQDIQDSM